jgi:holo-[acyl-carrier protein] synthase
MNKIFSIGVDIESIKRFKNLGRKESVEFLSKIFTKKEMDYCFSKQYPAQHLAARFAGKEAVIKAIKAAGFNSSLQLNDIKIINDKNGAPSVSISNHKIVKKRSIIDSAKILISLSHCEDKAIAFALVIV